MWKSAWRATDSPKPHHETKISPYETKGCVEQYNLEDKEESNLPITHYFPKDEVICEEKKRAYETDNPFITLGSSVSWH